MPKKSGNQHGSNEKSKGLTGAYFQLYRYAQPFDHLLLLLGTTCALAGGVPLPLIGVVFGELINDFSSQFRTIEGISRLSPEQIASFKQAIHTEVLYLIYIAIGYFLVTYVYTVCWSTLGERMTRQIRIHYLAAVLDQEIAYFETVGSGEVSNRITGDTQTIQNGTSEKVGLCLQSASYFISAFIVGFVKDAKLTGIMFSVVPAIFIVITGASRYIAKNTEKASASQSDASTFSQDALTNIRVSQAFSLQQRLGKTLDGFLEKAFKYGCRKALWAALMLGSIFWVAYSANALAFWEGGRIILSEQTGNVGAVYTVVFLILDSSFVVGQISPFLQTFSLAAGAGIKLFATIDRKPQISTTDLKENTVSNFQGDIELEGVRFAYPSSSGQEVLKGVNMKFSTGKTTAIVGVSGSGKSTIVSLLERFYDPTGGTIYFDRHSTKELNLAWLRSQIGLVTQMPTLFNTTILENIAYGYNQPHLTQEISTEKLKDLCILAAQQANAHEFVSRLPNGYNTKVGEGGIALSGGQKQRIALARAIISNPKVLILDEATSALDAASEAIVQEALDRVAAERTTIVIAHKLSTIKNADNILVMADGVVLEEGTHDQLIRKHGAYHSMVQSQQHVPADNNEKVVEPLGSECDISEKVSVKSKEKISSSETIISFDDDGSTKKEFSSSVAAPSTKKMSTLMVLHRMVLICRPELPWIILGLATSAIIGGSTCAEALLFAHVVSALSMTDTPDAMRSQVAYFSMWFFIVAIVLFFAYCINGAAFGYVSEHLQKRVRNLAFVSVLRQDIAWHDEDEHSPSALIASLNTDAALLGGLSSTVIGTIFSVLINMSAGIILAHIVAWKIAVVILAAVPVMIVAGWLRIKVIADLHARHATAYVKSASLASEAVSSIQTVASLGREKDVCRLYEEAIQAPYEDSIKSLLKGNAWLSLGYSITYLLYALAYWWGSQLLSNGEYTSTQFFIVLPALLFSAQASGQMFSLAPDLTKAKMAAGRIFDLIELQPTIDVGSERNTIWKSTDIQGQVTFDDVHFRYESRREAPVLQGLKLQVNAGQFVALVGESGCGKTTALSLLERFYDVNQGSLLVDGKDVRSYEVNQLRSQIALVSQEPILYSGSVTFNVLLGSEGTPSIDDVYRVCKLANMHEEILSMPQGYDTEVGFRGSKLSGGQRQRVAIARALIRNPKILLLDEATSALDSQNERLVQDALNKAAEGRTTIAIAHRLSTIRRADCIFLIDGGRVVEQGKHDELLAKRSKYYTLFQHQTLSSELDRE